MSVGHDDFLLGKGIKSLSRAFDRESCSPRDTEKSTEGMAPSTYIRRKKQSRKGSMVQLSTSREHTLQRTTTRFYLLKTQSTPKVSQPISKPLLCSSVGEVYGDTLQMNQSVSS